MQAVLNSNGDTKIFFGGVAFLAKIIILLDGLGFLAIVKDIAKWRRMKGMIAPFRLGSPKM